MGPRKYTLPMGRILVVDDSGDARALMREVLEDAGYEVVEACDGEEVITRCLGRPVDAVILDIFMPRKDGIEALTELRQHFPGIPVVAVSAGWNYFEKRDVLAWASELGASVALRKPFDPQCLIDAVDGVLAPRPPVPPSRDLWTTAERRGRVRERLRSGRLPDVEPAQATTATGIGSACAACGAVIRTGGLEVHLEESGPPPVYFHGECARLWTEERRDLDAIRRFRREATG